jgi:transposase
MKQYAGLDVSLKETSICIVDETGKVLHRGSAATEPRAVAEFLSEKAPDLDRAVHESGMLSTWLTRGLDALDVPIVCIDARKAHKALSARLNKSDKADAEGLAQLSRTGWYTQVHIRSEAADRLKALCRVALNFEMRRVWRRSLPLIARFGCHGACASHALLRNVIDGSTQKWLLLEGAQESNPCIVVDAVADDGCLSQGMRSSGGDCGEAEQSHFLSGVLKCE